MRVGINIDFLLESEFASGYDAGTAVNHHNDGIPCKWPLRGPCFWEGIMDISRSWLKIAAVGIGLVASVTMAQAQELRIGTASQGGAFYPVGQAISTLVGKHSDGLTMVPVVTFLPMLP